MPCARLPPAEPAFAPAWKAIGTGPTAARLASSSASCVAQTTLVDPEGMVTRGAGKSIKPRSSICLSAVRPVTSCRRPFFPNHPRRSQSQRDSPVLLRSVSSCTLVASSTSTSAGSERPLTIASVSMPRSLTIQGHRVQQIQIRGIGSCMTPATVPRTTKHIYFTRTQRSGGILLMELT